MNDQATSDNVEFNPGLPIGTRFEHHGVTFELGSVLRKDSTFCRGAIYRARWKRFMGAMNRAPTRQTAKRPQPLLDTLLDFESPVLSVEALERLRHPVPQAPIRKGKGAHAAAPILQVAWLFSRRFPWTSLGNPQARARRHQAKHRRMPRVPDGCTRLP